MATFDYTIEEKRQNVSAPRHVIPTLRGRRAMSLPVLNAGVSRTQSMEAISLFQDRMLQLEQQMVRLTMQHQEDLKSQRTDTERAMTRLLHEVQGEWQEVRDELRQLKHTVRLPLGDSLSSIEILRGGTPEKDAENDEKRKDTDSTNKDKMEGLHRRSKRKTKPVDRYQAGKVIKTVYESPVDEETEEEDEEEDEDHLSQAIVKSKVCCGIKEKPPSFDGSNVPVEDYIEHLRMHFKTTSHAEAYYVRNVAPRGFRGCAQVWHRHSRPYRTMKQLCRALRIQFALTKMEAHAKLKGRKQTWGESTKIVLLELNTYYDAAMPYLTDELRLEEAVKDNLRAETIDAIYTLNICSMSEAIRFADMIDRRAAGLIARENLSPERRSRRKTPTLGRCPGGFVPSTKTTTKTVNQKDNATSTTAADQEQPITYKPKPNRKLPQGFKWVFFRKKQLWVVTDANGNWVCHRCFQTGHLARNCPQGNDGAPSEEQPVAGGV